MKEPVPTSSRLECEKSAVLESPAHASCEETIHTVQPERSNTLELRSQRLLVLSGPTGVGKTALSIEIAKKLGGEIVSADSMQVYRGMDIGTAKASEEERAAIPHHMIDVCDVSRSYNVKEFFDDAQEVISAIFARSHVPIIVGGTGFYIHALIYGPPSGPPSDPEIRRSLECEEEKFGSEFLYEKLRSFDPIYAATITMSDRHKVLRGLEIIEISGKRVSDFSWKVRMPLNQYDFRLWFLYMPRPLLYARLEDRCAEMITKGLLEEVVQLDRLGIRKNRTASQAIGYRETLEFLDTAKTREDYDRYVERFTMASRHLAKKQFTWFGKEPYFRWVDTTSIGRAALIDWICEDYSSGLGSVQE